MEKINSKIEGVQILKKNQITDDRGKVMHMLRNDDNNFEKFGEIYFSTVNPKFVKAWHLHEKMTLNYVAVHGKIKLVLYDDRKKSRSNGMLEEILLSSDDYKLVTIPPNIWNGFSSQDSNIAIIANCSNIPHDKKEIIRIPFDDPKIPYKWKFDF
jgi:dTDP-4-dehydrorhamnose 3,5-epimerase|tara:strand:- start:332 stop:796 length:465 start_codon:yes stop_codon:yes gene_type:complete